MIRTVAHRLLMPCILACSLAAADDGPSAEPQSKIERLFGVLIEGAEWRTPNPGYDASQKSPKEYVLRYRWGPHKQHMIGELLGHFETPDGPQETLFWSLYAIHNPVTDEVQVSQIGADGALAAGEARLDGDDKHVIEQTLYATDGSTLALRHEETLAADGTSYTSNVFERNAAGDWTKARDWVWTRSTAP